MEGKFFDEKFAKRSVDEIVIVTVDEIDVMLSACQQLACR